MTSIEHNATPQMGAHKLDEALASMGAPRVLVAEDDDEIRALIVEALRSDGHEVIEARDGVELLKHMGCAITNDGDVGQLPDVIVTDVRMPGVTGIEAIARVREAHVRTPVVLITAFGNEDVYKTARHLDIYAVMDKPFDVDDLRAAVLSIVPSEAWRRSSRGDNYAERFFGVGTDHTPG